MRSVLFLISSQTRVPLGPLGDVPLFGLGLLLALWAIAGSIMLTLAVRRVGWKQLPLFSLIVYGAIGLAIHEAPRFLPDIPIYGYGSMLFLGFLTSSWWAARRIRNLGYDGEIAWDAAMWVFIAGIVGARIFYIVQYHERFFIAGRSVGQTLFSLINLPDGELVFFGGMMLGAVAFPLFCRLRGVRVLPLADLVITSVFLGLMFGRLGCLLNGCCYGELANVPWAIQFPHNSVPFVAQVQRGLLSADAPHSLALHPVQIYAAINAAVLALLTWAYYPFRNRDGAVLALGWLAYPIVRIVEEFLRSDEPGRFGTPFTISQWVSFLLFLTGLAFIAWLRTARPARLPLMVEPAPSPVAAAPVVKT